MIAFQSENGLRPVIALTLGKFVSLSTTPIFLRIPRVPYFLAIWDLNASDGTTTNVLMHWCATIKESIVSVLPVPVGITIMPFSSSPHSKWAIIEWSAPICGERKPCFSSENSVAFCALLKWKWPSHDWAISTGVIFWMSDFIKYQSRDTQTSIEEVGGRILLQNYKIFF